MTLIRRTVSGRDEYNNDTYSETKQAVSGCVVQPSGSSETIQFTDQVSTDLAVFIPAGIDVSPVDAIEIDGTRYEIQGQPSEWRSPFSGNTSPTQLRVTKVTGASV